MASPFKNVLGYQLQVFGAYICIPSENHTDVLYVPFIELSLASTIWLVKVFIVLFLVKNV